MGRLMRIARAAKVKILEDACQADGGSYRGKRLGSIGHAGGLSFNQFKIISCGEGGALVTNDKTLFHGALIHHDGGCAFRRHAGDMTVPLFAGLNFRLTEVHGAILRVQLKRLDGILKKLRARKRAAAQILGESNVLSLNPVHDIEGDCGTTLAMLFESSDTMRAVQAAAKPEGINLSSPIDSGMHVYSNWTPILEQRGAHHPKRDGFRLARREIRYAKDMCPQTTDVLQRTAYLGIDPGRSVPTIRSLARKLRKLVESRRPAAA
jgi:dTDP-4-amino-4,6-dideoxygalactose transaminase